MEPCAEGVANCVSKIGRLGSGMSARLAGLGGRVRNRPSCFSGAIQLSATPSWSEACLLIGSQYDSALQTARGFEASVCQESSQGVDERSLCSRSCHSQSI